MEPKQAKLTAGCAALGLTLSAMQEQQLLDYVALLEKWNKAYNLTAVRDPLEMISRHLLDSLAILPHIQGSSLLDVGTGAGLPGIPLAIIKPALQVALLDSNSKKTRFLQQAKAELGLESVTVVHGRVEQVDVEQQFDIVTARAFASMEDAVLLAGSHCKQDGYLLLMVGQAPDVSLQQKIGEFEVSDIQMLEVPDTEGERHIVKLTRL